MPCEHREYSLTLGLHSYSGTCDGKRVAMSKKKKKREKNAMAKLIHHLPKDHEKNRKTHFSSKRRGGGERKIDK